jgi:hypothetical protein
MITVRNFLCLLAVAMILSFGVAIALGIVTFTTSRASDGWSATVLVHTNKIPFTNEVEPNDNNLIDIKGKITAVNPEKKQLVVSENVKNWTFRVSQDAKVILNDQDSSLADLKAGDDAIVTFNRQAQELVATVVRSTRK